MKEAIEKLKDALASADCILIGVGAGLSAAAGYDYAGTRFLKYFSDFHERFGIEDIYSGGFYPFPTREMFSGRGGAGASTSTATRRFPRATFIQICCTS